MEPRERRDVLRLVAAAAAGGTAGCAGAFDDGTDDASADGENESGGDNGTDDETDEGTDGEGSDADETDEDEDEDDADDDLPGYARWLPSAGYFGGNALVLTVDADAIDEIESLGDTVDMDEEAPDELLREKVAIAPLLTLFARRGFSDVGLEGEFDDPDGGAADVCLIGNTAVLPGSFDPDALAERVTAAGLEEVRSRGEYAVYERAEDDEDAQFDVVALGPDGVVLPNSSDDAPIEDALRLVDARRGEGRLVEDRPDLRDAIGRVPDRDVRIVSYDPEPVVLGEAEDNALEGLAHGYVYGADVADGTLDVSTALLYAGDDEVDPEGRIGDEVAGAATGRSVTIEGSIAVVEGSYDLDGSGGSGSSAGGGDGNETASIAGPARPDAIGRLL